MNQEQPSQDLEILGSKRTLKASHRLVVRMSQHGASLEDLTDDRKAAYTASVLIWSMLERPGNITPEDIGEEMFREGKTEEWLKVAAELMKAAGFGDEEKKSQQDFEHGPSTDTESV